MFIPGDALNDDKTSVEAHRAEPDTARSFTTADALERAVSLSDHGCAATLFGFDFAAAALFDFGRGRLFSGWSMVAHGGKGVLKGLVFVHRRLPFGASDTLGSRGIYERDAAEHVLVPAKPADV